MCARGVEPRPRACTPGAATSPHALRESASPPSCGDDGNIADAPRSASAHCDLRALRPPDTARSYIQLGSIRSTRASTPICQGITRIPTPAAIASSACRANLSAGIRNGMEYELPRVSGVSTYPGAIVTTRTPNGRHSTRRLSQKLMTPALLSE